MSLIYNFSAGPAMIPKEVLYQAQDELLNWNQLGSSVMEISHRSKEFIQLAYESEQNLRDLLNIPDYYKILFFQGGARGQFSAIPLNLLGNSNEADYINSGYWSYCAFREAKKYCTPRNILIQRTSKKKIFLLHPKKWDINNNSAYVHYCPNETVNGIAIYEEPCLKNKIVVGDFSSCILSRSINIQKYGLIYAGAQKNIGPAGITIVIVKKDLINYSSKLAPSILDYHTMSKHQSMFNTPATFSWYLSGLVFKWLQKKGGIKNIEKINQKKAHMLYQIIDKSDFYINDIASNNRSQMNVIFHLHDPCLNKIFLIEAEKQGLKGLKGHYIVGGMRASIYNAMPLEGVNTLVKFMLYFEKKYG